MANETDGGMPAPGMPTEARPDAGAAERLSEGLLVRGAATGRALDGNWNPQINLDLHTSGTPI